MVRLRLLLYLSAFIVFSSTLSAEKIVYPQAAVGPIGGGAFQIELRLGNKNEEENWQGQVRLLEQTDLSGMVGLDVFDADGQPIPANNGVLNVDLEAGGSAFYQISSPTLQIGVMVIEPSLGSLDDLLASFYYKLLDGTGRGTDLIAIQGARTANTGYRVLISTIPTFNVGVAVVADKSLDGGLDAGEIEVTLTVIRENGEEDSTTITLGAANGLQQALFPSDVIDETGGAAVAQLRISSSELLYVATLAVATPPDFQTVQIGAAPADPDVDFPFTNLQVDTQDRAAVVEFFNTVYQASNSVPVGWNGDEATCSPGTVSAAFNQALLRRINWFRAMAGVPADIVFSEEFNTMTQQMALMMVASNMSSHMPSAETFQCFTEDGREAAEKSNLFYLGQAAPTVTNVIDGYIRDSGTVNTAVGHRRWVLFPRQEVMGSGTAQTATDSANALYVVGDFAAGPLVRSSWPPAGFVPAQVVFPRWSFSFPAADFSQATVSMTQGGTEVSLTIEPLQNNPPFGDPTIVWVPDIPSEAPGVDTAYTVRIENVLVNGDSMSFEYDVTIIGSAQ